MSGRALRDVQQERAVARSELDEEARRRPARRAARSSRGPVSHEGVDLLKIAPRLNGAGVVDGKLVENFRLDVQRMLHGR